MAYRISLHLLAMVWHCLLLALAISLRKSHRPYEGLIPLCLFSALFTSTLALGLIFQSDFFIRMTWIGSLWPPSLLFFMREIFQIESSPSFKKGMWAFSIFNTIVGLTPYALIKVSSFSPELTAQYGIAEPILRIGLFIEIIFIPWTAFSCFFKSGKKLSGLEKITLLVFSIYGIGALLTCSLLPLLGTYNWLESTSFTSIIWTTYAVWFVFKDLEKKNQSLIELDQMKRELINHVTHEFRTPLVSISSALSILSETRLSKEKAANEYLRMIESNTQRLEHFINELLTLAAIQQSKITIHKEEIDLNLLITQSIHEVSPIANKSNVSILYQEKTIMAYCDRDKIAQVLINLLTNAIKSSATEIQIISQTESGFIRIAVKDNGIGIPNENLEQIFSSFFQIQTKSSNIKGSGLGLAIAKAWVEAHGGRIWAESEGEGKGTKVIFTLPISNMDLI